MTRGRRRRWWTAIAGAALLAHGCGSSSSTTRTGSEPPSTPTATESSVATTAGSSVPATIEDIATSTSPPATDPPATDPPSTPAAAASSEWQSVALGAQVVDRNVAAVWSDGQTTVVFGSSDGQFNAAVLRDDGHVEVTTSSSVERPGEQFLRVGAIAATATGHVALGQRLPAFETVVWTSTDGLSWEEVDTVGLEPPRDLHSMVATETAIVAAGYSRDQANAPGPPLGPVIVRSNDGVTWTEVFFAPGLGDIRDVIAGSNTIVAAGMFERQGAIWWSADDGATWTAAQIESGAGEIVSVAPWGDELIAVSASFGPTDRTFGLLRSSDGGRTWGAATSVDPALLSGHGPGGEIVAAGDALWTTGRRVFIDFQNPDACYRSIEKCRMASEAMLLRSDDGSTWSEIDLAALGADRFLDIDLVVARDVGVTLIGSSRELTAWTWPTNDSPPLRPPDGPEEPLAPLARYMDDLEPGVLYRFPLLAHCGVEWLGQLDGRTWHLDAARSPAMPAPGEPFPSDWPETQEMIFGFLTLVDENTIEYSIGDGEVIAIYTPTDRQQPGCD